MALIFTVFKNRDQQVYKCHLFCASFFLCGVPIFAALNLTVPACFSWPTHKGTTLTQQRPGSDEGILPGSNQAGQPSLPTFLAPLQDIGQRQQNYTIPTLHNFHPILPKGDRRHFDVAASCSQWRNHFKEKLHIFLILLKSLCLQIIKLNQIRPCMNFSTQRKSNQG